MARDWMTCTALNTGNPGSLNTLDGAVLSDGDGALTLMDGVAYRHRLNATSGAAESSPLIIKPLYNAGNKRWELVEWYVPDATNAMSAMNRQSADARYLRDLQTMVYVGSSAFNSIAGVTVSLPRSVAAVDDYAVIVTADEDSGFIGDVWIEKATSGFTVYCSGSEAETAFTYSIIYATGA